MVLKAEDCGSSDLLEAAIEEEEDVEVRDLGLEMEGYSARTF